LAEGGVKALRAIKKRNQKAKGKRQKAKGKNEESRGLAGSPNVLIFAFCLLPFAF
jgi:hypothetical protein